MNLDFNEAQEMLRTSAKDFLSKECPKTKVREIEESDSGHDADLWKKMADLGWLGLALPEEYGGTGGDLLDLVIVLEEMGRNVLPGPFFSTVVDCSLAILQYGNDDQKKELLPKIAEGTIVMSLAILEPEGSYNPKGVMLQAKAEGDNYVLNGTKLFVFNANVADQLLVITRTSSAQDGLTAMIVDAKSSGIKIDEVPTTGFDKQCEVAFSNVSVPKKNVLGQVDKGKEVVDSIMEISAVMKSAEMLGGCEASVEMATAYAKERVQYGRPIGHFQVIQHYLVNMYMYTELIRNMVYQAGWMLSANVPCAAEISVLKAFASDSFKYVSERGVQVHGGIGTTRDHDMGLYYRRAWAWDHLYGNAAMHRDKIATLLGM